METSMFGAFAGQQYTIVAVRKQPRDDPYLPISHVQFGGTLAALTGGNNIVTLERAIEMIEGGAVMVTSRPGLLGSAMPAKVAIGVSPWGNKYLHTEADALLGNNLLSLPEC